MDVKYFHKVLSEPQLKMLGKRIQVIAERKYGVYDIKLCKFHHFYLEFFYIRGENILEQIISYDAETVIENYLPHIDISDIFQLARVAEN